MYFSRNFSKLPYSFFNMHHFWFLLYDVVKITLTYSPFNFSKSSYWKCETFFTTLYKCKNEVPPLKYWELFPNHNMRFSLWLFSNRTLPITTAFQKYHADMDLSLFVLIGFQRFQSALPGIFLSANVCKLKHNPWITFTITNSHSSPEVLCQKYAMNVL